MQYRPKASGDERDTVLLISLRNKGPRKALGLQLARIARHPHPRWLIRPVIASDHVVQ